MSVIDVDPEFADDILMKEWLENYSTPTEG